MMIPSLRMAPAAIGAVLGFALLAGALDPAQAQTIAVVVNGAPITTLQVSERQAFVRLTQKKNLSTREVTDTLIEEMLILKEGERYKLEVAESEIDERFNAVAQSVKLSPAQLSQALGQAGASARTFKQMIKSQIVYQRLIRGKFKPSNMVKESDIAAQIQQRREAGKDTAYRYTLRQIVFVLPKDAKEGLVAQRRREAEALRSRIQSCDAGVQLARGMRDVAVKDPVYRLSAQVSPSFREQIDKIKIGQATAPERVEHGVEIVALCAKEETKDDSAIRQEVQSKLADEQLKAESKKYLADLKRKAVIAYR